MLFCPEEQSIEKQRRQRTRVIAITYVYSLDHAGVNFHAMWSAPLPAPPAHHLDHPILLVCREVVVEG
jgi:hypothetical protein